MVKKEFTFKGKTVAQLKAMSVNEFGQLIPSKERRHLKRGFTDAEKKFLKEIRAGANNIKTHCRDIIILPEMIGALMKVYNGKEFLPLTVTEEMLGHRLGEFALTRRPVRHGAAGIGATRGTAHQSVR